VEEQRADQCGHSSMRKAKVVSYLCLGEAEEVILSGQREARDTSPLSSKPCVPFAIISMDPSGLVTPATVKGAISKVLEWYIRN
jgi:hypothetical protein